MARISLRHPGNAPGPWFVDTSCIDCDAARQCAPGLFAERDGQSVVARQPATPEEIRAATAAMLICPTGSIGVVGEKPATDEVFPMDLGEGVYLAGFASRESFGSNAYFVRRQAGNLLVDAPRFVPRLVRAFEELGGISLVLLTHKDSVANADRYAAYFGARVFIHEDDQDAAPFATDVLRGAEPAGIRPDLRAIPAPGHTRGSVLYLLDERALFTGDSLYWSRKLGDIAAFRKQCWYSWPAHTESLARLAGERFSWILPGHGTRCRLPEPEVGERLSRLVDRMRRDDPILASEGIAGGVAAW